MSHGNSADKDSNDATVLAELGKAVRKEAEEETEHNFSHYVFAEETCFFEYKGTQHTYSGSIAYLSQFQLGMSKRDWL